MVVDFSTTNYAISHNMGREGNVFMSGIVSNPILFILTKLIGTMVIIFMISKIIQKNEKYAKIGMRIIIAMMLLVIFNNGMVISASALSFSNFTSDGTGSINTGNGYFDDPQTAFGYTDNRNVYLTTENTEVVLVEPISWSSGFSPPSYVLVNSSGGLTDAVVHNGYVYFIEGTNLKKMKTRNAQITCQANDTTAGGCISSISTGVGESLKVYDGVLYYTVGNALKHLDTEDNEVSDFSLTTFPTGQTRVSSFGITKNSSNSNALTVYTTGLLGAADVYLYRCTSAGCVTSATNSHRVATGDHPSVDTYYATSTFMYVFTYAPFDGDTFESLISITNFSKTTYDIITQVYSHRNRAYVGGQSTIGLLAYDSLTYQTFNSNEAGIDSLPVVPTDLEYQTSTIESLETQYYNKSDIYLNYNVIISSLNANNILLDFNDYRWMISMTDPNGVTQDIVQSPACSFDSILDTTCQITSQMGIRSPANGWLQGTWYAKLYEINTVTSSRALVSTSSGFTVLNTSLENQSIISPPFIPPTAGTAPQAITKIDGFVGWLGLGVNSVSKLLFAMIIIAIASTVGLIWGNGNIAMVFAFVPYSFFTFIDYIPKWIFIITIILMAIVSRVFR